MRPCGLFELAKLADRAGRTDRAIALYDRGITRAEPQPVSGTMPTSCPTRSSGSGELYEAKGDRAKAADRYRRFVELWKDADPELQPGCARCAPASPGWPRRPGDLSPSAMLLDDRALLARLVAFDTTSHASNLPLADFLADYLDRPGVRIERNPSADGAKTNLVVAVGPETDDRSGLVLSGHMDVVPAPKSATGGPIRSP